MDTHPSPLATTAEVADALRCSLPTVRRLLDDGKLKGHRDGRRIRIVRASVKAYLESTAIGGGRA